MSLFTITFDSSEESSDEPMQTLPQKSTSTVPQKPAAPIQQKTVSVNVSKRIVTKEESNSESDDIPLITKQHHNPAPVKPQLKQTEPEYYSEYEYYDDEEPVVSKAPRPPKTSEAKPVPPPRAPAPAPAPAKSSCNEEEEEIEKEINRLKYGSDAPEKEPNLAKYKMIREKKKGSHYRSFTLVKNGECVLCTKIKDHSKIGIGKGGEFHISTTESIAEIRVKNHGRLYTLFRPDKDMMDGKEIMNIEFKLPNGANTPRELVMKFVEPIQGVPCEIANRMPRRVKGGGWVVNLGGRYAVRSRKNCIMVDSEDREVMSAIKIDKDEISLEMRPDISEVALFAFAIACFTCTL